MPSDRGNHGAAGAARKGKSNRTKSSYQTDASGGSERNIRGCIIASLMERSDRVMQRKNAEWASSAPIMVIDYSQMIFTRGSERHDLISTTSETISRRKCRPFSQTERSVVTVGGPSDPPARTADQD